MELRENYNLSPEREAELFRQVQEAHQEVSAILSDIARHLETTPDRNAANRQVLETLGTRLDEANTRSMRLTDEWLTFVRALADGEEQRD